MARNSGALVVGYRKGDVRRFQRTVQSGLVKAGGRGLFLPTRTVALHDQYVCNRNAGPCISCGEDVYLNEWGYSALLEKDADAACMDCEDRYSADITRSL